MIAAIRMLAYGVSTDFMDEYLRIGVSTTIKSLKQFVKVVVSIFFEEYLRSPNNNDIARLLAVGQHRGFPGMLGSIDCMHWKWKNCPSKWKGQYIGHTRDPTIILEIVASYDLWIWYAFCGLPGSHNDINVLEWSSVFFELAEACAPPVNYSINGNDYSMGYYLAVMSDILTLEQMTLIMIKSIIVDPNWCHIIPLVTLCSSLNVIIPLEIEEFVLNFKRISLSIFGNFKASRRNLEI
ncbi:hypothetical protein SO802_011699 [Lithocarpus litseifolius]|uniref:Nuclease HARBI1 n=1 Tax=Lithocarpus litseifolius TaxID=425828 RepID=A0AAW2D360_9ROSI